MTTQVKIETENRIPIWRLFSETGSSNVSVVDWDISSKFGIDFDLVNVCHHKTRRLCRRHLATILKNWYDVLTPQWVVRFGQNLVNRTKMSKSKPHVEISIWQLCRLSLFSETGTSNISAVDWVISTKLRIQPDFGLHKRVPSLIPKSKVDLRLYDHSHLVKSIWCHKYAANSPIPVKFGKPMQNWHTHDDK